MTVLAKALGALGALVVPIWGVVKLWNQKVDKHTYKSDQQAVAAKFEVHRLDIAKVFDVLRTQDETAEQRHRELLMHLLKKGD